jgi:glutathione S-transferase
MLTVYGDYLNNDTRTILQITKMCSIEVNFIEIDTLQGKHKHDDYKSINPLQSVPTLTEDRFKVLGNTGVFMHYLANRK